MSKNDVIRQLADAAKIPLLKGRLTPSGVRKPKEAIAAGEAELAKPEPEPVAWSKAGNLVHHVGYASYIENVKHGWKPLYTTPPEPKEWKLVPVEPTEEIIKAGESVKQYDLDTPYKRWEAMLRSAPGYKG